MYLRQRKDTLKVNDFKYVIIDTDCGGDDAQALVLIDYLVKKHGKTLLGITCVDGNAALQDVVNNVLIVQAVCQSKHPVFVGAKSSIAGETLKDNFFLKDGLGGTQKHYMEKLAINKDLVQKQKAYKFIADSAIKHKGELAIICIGPLTNLALAYHYNNKIVDCITNISIMGSSDTLAGLHTFYTAEFNIGLDPEAAYAVFEKFNNIIVSSLDTAFSFPAEETVKLFQCDKTPKSDFIRNIHAYQFKIPITPQVIDPMAVFALFEPESVVDGIKMRMRIQVKGKRTRGCSVIDYFSADSHKHNIFMVREFDVKIVNSEIEKSYQ